MPSHSQFEFIGPARGANRFKCLKCGAIYHLYSRDQLEFLENNGCKECKKKKDRKNWYYRAS